MNNRVLRIRDRPPIARWSGLAAVAGCCAAALTHFAGHVLNEGTDFVSDTISDLAAGSFGWVQDCGLYAIALGMALLGIGYAETRRGLTRWRRALAAILVLLAIDVVLIAAVHEYDDNDADKYDIHLECVAALAALVPAGMVATSYSYRPANGQWRHGWCWCALAWVVLAAPYWFLPDWIDGIYERGLATMMAVWIGALGLALARALPD